MKLKNLLEAGEDVVTPSGEIAQFDPDGIAEVSPSCGLNLVPGYEVVEGTPEVFVCEKTAAVRAPDGRHVEVFGPAWAENAKVACPDGHTTASFDGGDPPRAVVPETCGLPDHPEYRRGEYVDPVAEPANTVPSGKPEERLQDAGIAAAHVLAKLMEFAKGNPALSEALSQAMAPTDAEPAEPAEELAQEPNGEAEAPADQAPASEAKPKRKPGPKPKEKTEKPALPEPTAEELMAQAAQAAAAAQ